MCEPTTIAMASLALSAASTAVSYQQQAGQAKVQNQIHQNNQALALQSRNQSFADLSARQQQEAQAAAQQINQQNREALQTAASVQVQMGESGVAGFSMNNIMRDIYGQSARNISTIENNRDWTLGQLEREKDGLQASYKGQANSTSGAMRPSLLAAGLQIGDAALSSYGTYKKLSATTTKR